MDNIWVHQDQSQKLIGGPGDPIISKEGSVFTPSQPPEAPPWVWLSANGQKTSHLMLDQPQLWFQDVWGHFCIGRNQTEDHLMPSLIIWLRTLRRKYGGVWIRFEVARMESGWCQREKPVKTGCNGDPSILGRPKFAYSVFTPFYSIFAPFSAISSLQIICLGCRHNIENAWKILNFDIFGWFWVRMHFCEGDNWNVQNRHNHHRGTSITTRH